jgi:hypothetical protein
MSMLACAHTMMKNEETNSVQTRGAQQDKKTGLDPGKGQFLQSNIIPSNISTAYLSSNNFPSNMSILNTRSIFFPSNIS